MLNKGTKFLKHLRDRIRIYWPNTTKEPTRNNQPSPYFKEYWRPPEIETNFPNKGPLALYCSPIGNYSVPSDCPSDVIIQSIQKGEIFEPEIVKVSQSLIRPGSTVLDVGANFGQMSVEFARATGPTGQVYAFEADPFLAAILKINLDLNKIKNVKVFSNAVWHEAGKTLFYPEPDFARFGSYGSYGIDPQALSGREVKSITIDSLNIKTPISFLKVDIQGSDLFALLGAKNTIMQHRMPILFEFEEQFQKEFHTSFESYSKFIEEVGYKVDAVINEINYLIVPK